MHGELLLVNPRAKRGKNGRFVKRTRAKRKNSRRRRRNPVAAVAAVNPRRRRRRNPVAAFAANPRRRRRARRVYATSSRRRRRNPRFSLAPSSLMNFVAPAAIGGTGALLLDIGLAAIPLPEQFKSGPLNTLAKVGGAMLLGYGVGKVKSGWGKPVTLGALTVIAYGAIRELATRFAPQLPGLSDFPDYQVGYIDPAPQLQGSSAMGAYMQPAGGTVGMGAYMEPSQMSGYADDGM